MTKTRIIRVDPRKLVLLERNAHYMRHETFQQLVENIRRDGCLKSVPLVALVDEASAALPDDAPGKWRVLSGNHRTTAAIDAEIAEVDVMVEDRVLSRDELVAVALSHNALVGQDDPAILRELYEQIENVDWRIYAGLDDKTLDLMADVQVGSINEANLDFQTVSVVFLPSELEQAKEAWEKARGIVSGDELWLARFSDYDAFLEAMELSGASYNVKNVATQLMLVLGVFEKHATDLKDGWIDEEGEARHSGWVPLSGIFGKSKIPAKAAVVIHRAIKKMVDRGEVPSEQVWQALEFWAADYLAGE